VLLAGVPTQPAGGDGSDQSEEPKVGDTHDTIGQALTAALRLVGRNPKLRTEARDGSPEAIELLNGLQRDPDIQAYMRGCRYRDVLSGVAMERLLDLAEDWLIEGQRLAVAALYEERIADGTIASLRLESDRLVHEAVFMLANRDGPRVRAALPYVEVLLSAEFGHSPSREAIRKSYRRLEQRGLVELVVGRRGLGKMRTTVVSIAPFITSRPVVMSIDTFAVLTLSQRTVTALDEYRLSRRLPRPWVKPEPPR
jgi:hypothetical protein